MTFKIAFLIFCELFQKNSCFNTISFEDLEKSVLGPDFVDKTLLLKEVFNAKKTLFIAAPVGFGKTFNLMLMKSFLSADEIYNERLFKHTEIFQDKNFTTKEFGNYAVLYCNFQQRVPVYDYRSMINAFREVLHKTFLLHSYLVKGKKISSSDKKVLTFYTGIKKHLNLSSIQILRGLYFLSKLMKVYHEKQVILMIDEYDTFILNGIFSKELEYKHVLGFHNAFFSIILHENEYVSRSIMLGTSCMSMKSLVHTQNFECVEFLRNKRFSPFFGITEKEIDGLLAKKEFKKMSKMKWEIKQWYNGYKSSDLEMHVYNTKSTLSFLNTGKLKCYWADQRAIKPLKYLLIEPVALQLLNNSILYKPIHINTTEHIQTCHIKGLKSFTENELWDERFGDVFIQFLMEMGYFTNAGKMKMSDQTGAIYVGIPNKEVCTVFKKILTSFLTDPKELLDRLKATVHELSFSDKQNKVGEESIIKLHANVRKGRNRPKRIKKN